MSADPITWQTTHGDTVEVYAAVQLEDDPFLDFRGYFETRQVEVRAVTPQRWRYRVRATNNKVVETGSEAYTRRRAAVKAAERHHPRVEASPEVQVGQLWRSSDEPNPNDEGLCLARSPGESGFLCCRRAGHGAPHIAGNGTRVVAVWP